jgi:hypothetical protein
MTRFRRPLTPRGRGQQPAASHIDTLDHCRSCSCLTLLRRGPPTPPTPLPPLGWEELSTTNRRGRLESVATLGHTSTYLLARIARTRFLLLFPSSPMTTLLTCGNFFLSFFLLGTI